MSREVAETAVGGCHGRKKDGTQCRKAPIEGGTVCSKHGGRAPHIKNAARVRIEMAADRLARQLLGMAEDPDMPPAINGGLAAALADLAAGLADGLVVAKMDRLARSIQHAARVMDTAREQGWNLVVLDLGMDLTTPQGRAMANMLATFAEFEREMISIRTKEAHGGGEDHARHALRPAPACVDGVDSADRACS